MWHVVNVSTSGCSNDAHCENHETCINEKCTNPCTTQLEEKQLKCNVTEWCRAKDHIAYCTSNKPHGNIFRILLITFEILF